MTMMTPATPPRPTTLRLSRAKYDAVLAVLFTVISGNMAILLLTNMEPIVTDGKTKNKATLGINLPLTPRTGPSGANGPMSSEAQSYPPLNCEPYGGPAQDLAQEMVYWQDIRTDYDFRSPFSSYDATDVATDGTRSDHRRFLTVEPDAAGFNNYRMAMEVHVVLAVATGRVLVIPPARVVAHLDDKTPHNFTDFFDLESIAKKFNNTSFGVIPYQDYLKQEFPQLGRFQESHAGRQGKPALLAGNRTDWNGHPQASQKVDLWLRKYTASPEWGSEHCLLVIPKRGPSTSNSHSIRKYSARLKTRAQQLLDFALRRPHTERKSQRGHPAPIDASAPKRLEEVMGKRTDLCVYDGAEQSRKYLHIRSDPTPKGRIIAHFYNYLFFEDWRVALWTKRFVRDNLRYKDEVQCAAARIVAQMRAFAKAKPRSYNFDGGFYSMHIRRTDLIDAFKTAELDAEEIYDVVASIIPNDQTIYISTDEDDHAFFDVFRERGHSIYFFRDFLPQDSDDDYYLGGLHKDYHGLVEQLVASRAKIFVGCYYSTFTGYVNRLRGYHSQKLKLSRWREGVIDSYYYSPGSARNIHRQYTLMQDTLWGQEYPVGWRDIDHAFLPWHDES
jgi:GDP-fucose protein O-fucosyltransferase